MRHHAHRVDANQPDIFSAWDKLGATYFNTSGLGDGFPDAILWTLSGRLLFVEIKVPGEQLNIYETKFRKKCTQSGIPYQIAETPEVAEILWREG